MKKSAKKGGSIWPVILVIILLTPLTMCSAILQESDSEDLSAEVIANQTNPTATNPISIVPTPSPSETTPDKQNLQYHKNTKVNALIANYNEVASEGYKITPDMVNDGAYESNALIGAYGSSILVYSNSGKMFVEIRDHVENKSNVEALFSGFVKALNPEVSDDELNTAWVELQTEHYNNYKTYDFAGLSASYLVNDLTNGDLTVKVTTG